MYTNNLVLSLGTSLRNERKGDLRIQSRPFCAMLALSCLLLFTAATGSAQQNNTINTVAGQAPFNAVALQMSRTTLVAGHRRSFPRRAAARKGMQIFSSPLSTDDRCHRPPARITPCGSEHTISGDGSLWSWSGAR